MTRGNLRILAPAMYGPPHVVGSSGNSSTSSTTVAVTKPSGVSDGLLLLAAMCVGQSGRAWSGDTGWTERIDDCGTQPGIRIATKVAASEGSSYTFTADSSTNALVAAVVALGPAAYSVIGSAGPGSSSLSLSGITMPRAGLLVAAVSNKGTDAVNPSISSSVMTQAISTLEPGNHLRLSVFTQAVGAGATGSRSFTCGGTANSSYGVLIGITRS